MPHPPTEVAGLHAGPNSVEGFDNDPNGFGVRGSLIGGNASGAGVVGVIVEGASGVGVRGTNDVANAAGSLGCVDPQFHQHAGVYGESDQQGVMGLTTVSKGTGVYGGGTTAAGGDQIGVRGETQTGLGVFGHSFGSGHGVLGQSDSSGHGVFGQSKTSRGVGGISESDIGVAGFSTTGIGVQGQSLGSGLAGKFIGNVEITGNLHMSTSTSDITLGDVAEGFFGPDGETIQPGTVVVLDEAGLVRVAADAYDRKVAGVISGAGRYRPAIVLDKQSSQVDHLPVALMGKVCCKVDAQYAPIEVGDLLTTSNTPGYAMKATDPLRAFGSVIGKALRSLAVGQDLIPILVSLQ